MSKKYRKEYVVGDIVQLRSQHSGSPHSPKLFRVVEINLYWWAMGIRIRPVDDSSLPFTVNKKEAVLVASNARNN